MTRSAIPLSSPRSTCRKPGSSSTISTEPTLGIPGLFLQLRVQRNHTLVGLLQFGGQLAVQGDDALVGLLRLTVEPEQLLRLPLQVAERGDQVVVLPAQLIQRGDRDQGTQPPAGAAEIGTAAGPGARPGRIGDARPSSLKTTRMPGRPAGDVTLSMVAAPPSP